MNNDPSSSTPAAISSTGSNSDSAPGLQNASMREVGFARKVTKERVLEQTKKKVEFLGHILSNLDMLIYAELCCLYYMEYVCLTVFADD